MTQLSARPVPSMTVCPQRTLAVPDPCLEAGYLWQGIA